MSIQRKYRLNLRNYGNMPAIMVSQYDAGYNLVFEIYDGASPASDLSAYTVTLKGTRCDGLGFTFVGTVASNVLSFLIDNSMTAVSGRGSAEVVITDNNDLIFASFNLPVFVEKAVHPDSTVDADTVQQQTLLEQIQAAASSVTDMTVSSTTLAAGSEATVTKTTVDDVINLEFGLPQGATGATGATPSFTIGTVTTLDPDDDATATITGTAANPVLNLGIPKGDTGEVSQAEFDEVAGDVSQLKSDLNDVNAELADVRVGADGTIYGSAGAAVRGQVDEVKTDLTNYEKYFIGLENPIDIASWTYGHNIAADGTIGTHDNFKYSSLIPIDNSLAYTFVWSSTSASTIRIHGYDSNGDWVEQVDTFSSGSGGLNSKVLVKASSVKYLRISSAKTVKSLALYSGKTVNEKLEYAINILGQISFNLTDLVNTGSYIGQDGTIVDTSLAFARSDMIPAFNLSNVLIVRSPRISGGCAVAFYSDNEFTTESFISGYEKSSITTNTVVPVPSGTKYIAFSARTNEGSFSVELGFEKMIEVIQNNASKVDEIFNYPHKGEKLSILGDSISSYSGYIPSGNAAFYPKAWMNSVENTWWKKLLEETKMDLLINNSSSGSHMATNDSLSGLSRCENLDDGVDVPDHVIVYMGVNDFANGNGIVGECGLNESTYNINNFSDAYYTALNNIKTKYPNAQIYLCTIMQYALEVSFPNKKHNVYLTVFNDAIRKLADIFGAEVIEFTKCGIDYFNQSTTLGDTLHPNVIGHNLMYKEALKHFK